MSNPDQPGYLDDGPSLQDEAELTIPFPWKRFATSGAIVLVCAFFAFADQFSIWFLLLGIAILVVSILDYFKTQRWNKKVLSGELDPSVRRLNRGSLDVSPSSIDPAQEP